MSRAPTPSAEPPSVDDGFWTSYQPGFRATSAEPGSPRFFDDVDRTRYVAEPHIPEVARFERWAGKDVLEVGCGIGTDGLQFVRAGARYTGLDASARALQVARERFDAAAVPGDFVHGSASALPFPDESFDLLFSHGVVHHIEDTRGALGEFFRVLRPGGTVLVMVYHRRSLNYYLTIMLVRRLLVASLLLPRAPQVVARLTGEPEEVLQGHLELLQRYRLRYLLDRELFLSNNTDGPANPLSKVYSDRALRKLLTGAGFEDVRTQKRFLNLRTYPGGSAVSRTRLARRLERSVGWHLYGEARRPARGW